MLDAARDHQATLFFGVPTMYARLAGSPRAGELGRLRLCVSGSAPLPPTVFERLAERAGQRVLERYGMTETIMNVSNPYDGERRPGTVGLPLPGVELRLAGGDRRRGAAARPQRVLRLLGQPGGHRRGLRPRRLVPHRRPRQLRRARLPAHRGPQQGADHHRRLQRPPPRGRGAAARAPRGGRGGGGRGPVGGVGRAGRPPSSSRPTRPPRPAATSCWPSPPSGWPASSGPGWSTTWRRCPATPSARS